MPHSLTHPSWFWKQKKQDGFYGNKNALGLEGFTFKFLKHLWELLQEDLVYVFNEFGFNGKISRGCNSKFITLIPKVKYHLTLDQQHQLVYLDAYTKIIVYDFNRLKS